MKLIYETKGYIKTIKEGDYSHPRTKVNIILLGFVVIIFAGLVAVLGWGALAEPPSTNLAPISFVDSQPKKNITDSPVGTIVLGKPTNTSVSANIVPGKNWEVVLQYGANSLQNPKYSEPRSSQDGQPIMIDINGLEPNTQYHYKMGYRTSSDQPYQMGEEYTFHTARAKGSAFTFTVQSDAHFDINSPELYKITAKNMLAAKPDFLLDLGDKTMSSDYATSYEKTQASFKNPRYYMSLVGSSAPVYLANGNHEGENGWLDNGSPESITVWSSQVRKLLFANPYPNDFYSGDKTNYPYTGLRASYYAWNWGDALFVVLDPLWHTKEFSGTNSNEDIWAMTLGDEQYKWLKQTLESSKSKYKFVFSHHILGTTFHGGIYWSQFGEWGGNNTDGGWAFNERRPTWAKPIRQLFENNKVSVFFQGHDHVFAKEDLNGVAYQTVPQPNSQYGQNWVDRNFAYAGDIQPSSGYIKVTVGDAKANVEYVKTILPAQETKKQKNADVSYSYTVYPSN